MIEKEFGEEVRDLLSAHLDELSAESPPESMHALPLDELKKPELTFWCAWQKVGSSSGPGSQHNEGLMGFAALKQMDAGHAELKSMRTHKNHLRAGVAKALLKEILSTAKSRGYSQISLETGSMESFKPAQALYSDFGFTFCPPFADYKEDPLSVFMTLKL